MNPPLHQQAAHPTLRGNAQRAPSIAPASNAYLVVGVTARRDIVTTSVPQLEMEVRAFLQRLRAEHPQLRIAVKSEMPEVGVHASDCSPFM